MAGTVMCPVMLAFAMMAAIRHRAAATAQKNETAPPGKSQSITTPPLIRWSIQEIRRIAIRLARSAPNPHIIVWSAGAQEADYVPLNAPTSNQECTLVPPAKRNFDGCRATKDLPVPGATEQLAMLSGCLQARGLVAPASETGVGPFRPLVISPPRPGGLRLFNRN